VPQSATRQNAVRTADGRAAAALMAVVRSSTTACTTWQAVEDGAKVTYTITQRPSGPTIGDDSSTYLLDFVSAKGQTLHAVQVYVVAGHTFSLVTYLSTTATSAADIAYTRATATAGAAKLATVP
jgi:hypothetical protein